MLGLRRGQRLFLPGLALYTCPMRIVVVMDPVSTVIVDEDTTFALMLEAQQRGHQVDHCLLPDVELSDGAVMATVRRCDVRRDAEEPVRLGAPEHIDLAKDADAVLVRKDPPFDGPYLWLTLMLDRIVGDTLVLNDPVGIRAANEKLYACRFPEWMPKTLVTRDKTRIRTFLEAQREETGTDRGAVIKPVDGHGGAGIFRIRLHDSNLNAAIEAVTREGRRVAMVQAFLPEVSVGDKRILLLEGEPLGAILRVPRGGDHRSNIHVGGTVEAAELTDKERALCAALKPSLARDGLIFVGIDVIGERLTEVNVTSPTGIQQMSRLTGRNCEAEVIGWLEAHAPGQE